MTTQSSVYGQADPNLHTQSSVSPTDENTPTLDHLSVPFIPTPSDDASNISAALAPTSVTDVTTTTPSITSSIAAVAIEVHSWSRVSTSNLPVEVAVTRGAETGSQSHVQSHIAGSIRDTDGRGQHVTSAVGTADTAIQTASTASPPFSVTVVQDTGSLETTDALPSQATVRSDSLLHSHKTLFTGGPAHAPWPSFSTSFLEDLTFTDGSVAVAATASVLDTSGFSGQTLAGTLEPGSSFATVASSSISPSALQGNSEGLEPSFVFDLTSSDSRHGSVGLSGGRATASGGSLRISATSPTESAAATGRSTTISFAERDVVTRETPRTTSQAATATAGVKNASTSMNDLSLATNMAQVNVTASSGPLASFGAGSSVVFNPTDDGKQAASQNTTGDWTSAESLTPLLTSSVETTVTATEDTATSSATSFSSSDISFNDSSLTLQSTGSGLQENFTAGSGFTSATESLPDGSGETVSSGDVSLTTTTTRVAVPTLTEISPTPTSDVFCSHSLEIGNGSAKGINGRADHSQDSLIIIIPVCLTFVFLVVVLIIMAFLCYRRRKKKRESKSSTEDLWVEPIAEQVPTISVSAAESSVAFEGPDKTEHKEELPVYRVIHEFPAQQETQLPLTPGDLVYVEEKADNGWWRGRVKDHERTGWFPFSFLEEVTEQATDKETDPTPAEDAQEAAGPDQQTSKPRISSFLIRKKQGNKSLRETSFSLKSITPQKKQAASVTRSASALTPVPALQLPGVTPHTNDDFNASVQGKHFKAVFAYKAAFRGEINLREGDIILAKERDRNGWMLGRKLKTGEEGWFPAVYVDMLSGDVVLEETKDQPHEGPHLDQEVYGLLAVNRNKSPDQAWVGIAHRAIQNHAGQTDTNLSFKVGDVLTVFEALDSGWWLGCHGDAVGWFPGAYAELLEEKSDDNNSLLDTLHLLPFRKDPASQGREKPPVSQRSSTASFNSDAKDLITDRRSTYSASSESILSDKPRPARRAPQPPAADKSFGSVSSMGNVPGMATLSRNLRPARPAPAPPTSKTRSSSVGSMDRLERPGHDGKENDANSLNSVPVKKPRKPKVVRIPKEKVGLDKISSCPAPSRRPPALGTSDAGGVDGFGGQEDPNVNTDAHKNEHKDVSESKNARNPEETKHVDDTGVSSFENKTTDTVSHSAVTGQGPVLSHPDTHGETSSKAGDADSEAAGRLEFGDQEKETESDSLSGLLLDSDSSQMKLSILGLTDALDSTCDLAQDKQEPAQNYEPGCLAHAEITSIVSAPSHSFVSESKPPETATSSESDVSGGSLHISTVDTTDSNRDRKVANKSETVGDSGAKSDDGKALENASDVNAQSVMGQNGEVSPSPQQHESPLLVVDTERQKASPSLSSHGPFGSAANALREEASPVSSDSESKASSGHRQNQPYWKFQSGDSQKHGIKPVRLTKVAPPVVPGAKTAEDKNTDGNRFEVPPAGVTGRVSKIVHQINRMTSFEEQNAPRRPSLQHSIGERHGAYDDTSSLSSSIMSEDHDTSVSKLSDLVVSDLPTDHDTRHSDLHPNGGFRSGHGDMPDTHTDSERGGGSLNSSFSSQADSSNNDSSPQHLEDRSGAACDSPPCNSRKKTCAPPPPLNRKLQRVPNGQAGFSEC